MGKCARANTLIDDPDTGARITLEECIQRRVPHVLGFTKDGRVGPQEIAEWVDSGIKPCFKVTTRTGRSVEVTGHHPFLTVRGWQPLHDIVVGEAIAVPRAVNCFGHDTTWSLGRVRLLAYFIAEGGLTGNTPGFTNTDSEILADFHSQIGELYPTLHVRRHAITYFPSGPHSKPNPLTTWLRELGLMGKLADQKRFPAHVWQWDSERLAEFIKVLMSCDGTVYAMGGYPRIEFAVASEGLAHDMHHALIRFGIVAKLWKKKDRCWRVEITEPMSVDLYQREIGWIGDKAGRFATNGKYRRGNLGLLPKAIWRDIRAAAEMRGLTLSAVAIRAGERGAGERGFNPHTSRGISQGRLANYADVLRDRAQQVDRSPRARANGELAHVHVGQPHQLAGVAVEIERPEADRAGLRKLAGEHRARPRRRVRAALDLLDRPQIGEAECPELDRRHRTLRSASGTRR